MSPSSRRVCSSILATAALAAGAACGSSHGDPPALDVGLPPRGGEANPAPTATATSTTPLPTEVTVPDAGPSSKHWTGTLAASPTVTFGGSPYCTYKITLKQIGVDLATNGGGDAVGASVTAQAVEEVVPPCSYAPTPPNAHTYTFQSASCLASGAVHVVLTPASGNQPKASLVVEGTLGAANAPLSLAWHRTDVPSPLDWRVNASVPVSGN